MKKVYGKLGLELNEKDNALTSLAKGGFKGIITYSTIAVPLMGALLLVGKTLGKSKEEVISIEVEEA